MYISKELLHNNSENKKLHLKKIMKNALEQMNYASDYDKLDKISVIETLACINAFIQLNNLELTLITYDINKVTFAATIKEILNNYYQEFIHKNIDLYEEYFCSKYEFKAETFEEIKKIVLELKTDIKEENSISKEEQQDIITIIDEIDNSLVPKSNDIDTVNGKLFRLKMTLNNLGVVTEKVNDKINTVFSKVNDINSFISNVQSIYHKVDGLITNVGKLLGN